MIVFAILPRRKPFGTKFAIEQAMRAAQEQVGRDAKADFEKTVATWASKPTFDVDVSQDRVKVSTGDENYSRVDQGTRPHMILPRRKRILLFRAGGSPKTRPGVLGSSGGSPGNTLVAARRVMHPGTRPRRFSELVRKRYEGKLTRYFKRMLDTAVNQT